MMARLPIIVFAAALTLLLGWSAVHFDFGELFGLFDRVVIITGGFSAASPSGGGVGGGGVSGPANIRIDWLVLGRIAMQAAVTFALGGASLFVILAKRYGPKDKNWAYTTIGALIGFWLK